jgi:hypothetical protein
MESEALIAIRETRRALTKLEFAAMDIDCQISEQALTKKLSALKVRANNLSRKFAT